MIIQGFFDDSGSHENSEIYIVAGLLARADRWGEFSDRWQSLLGKDPSVQAMHCFDAYNQRGEFRSGWNPSLIHQRIFECAELIAEYAVLRVHACIKRDDFDSFIKGVAPEPELNDPYFFCFYKILAKIAKYHVLVDARIETIFDEQGVIGPSSLGHWDFLKELYPKEFLQFERPKFESDRRVIPLQAADVYAYHLRGRLRDNFAGDLRLDAEHIDRVLAKIPHLSCIMEREEVISMGCSLLMARDSMLRGAR